MFQTITQFTITISDLTMMKDRNSLCLLSCD